MQEAVHPDALTIFGATFDDSLDDEIRVTVIATGFDKAPSNVSVPVETVAPKAVIAPSHVVLEPLEEKDVPKVEVTPEPDPFDDIFKIFNKRDE